MNILYISNLSGNMWAGPNNSVPAQIKAQSKIDNVFWYNINYVNKKEWEDLSIYHNLDSFSNKKIADLPRPFNMPDLVVFEGAYTYPFSKLVFEIWKKKTPYIIIPRSELTEKAQRHKSFKKKIGNYIFFNKFMKRALAIQYLTDKEYLDSGCKWNNNHIIIPNGIEYKEVQKDISQKGFKGIYIGRIEIYQKGLDLLVKACINLQENLRNSNCTIHLYGPDRENAKNKLNNMISNANIQDIIKISDGIFDEEKKNTQLNSDFFIMTSRFEGHPMGLIEALSYGLPSLVTIGSNMADEIKKMDAGWIAEGTIRSISEALKTLLNEKNKFKEKSENAIKLSKRYNWDQIAKRTHYEYEQILNNIPLNR